MGRRPTAKSVLGETKYSPSTVSIEVPYFPEELVEVRRSVAFLSLLANPHEQSWLIRPFAFRGFQLKPRRNGWTGYVKAIDNEGGYWVFSARGGGPVEVMSELYSSYSNQRVWRADAYPLKY